MGRRPSKRRSFHGWRNVTSTTTPTTATMATAIISTQQQHDTREEPSKARTVTPFVTSHRVCVGSHRGSEQWKNMSHSLRHRGNSPRARLSPARSITQHFRFHSDHVCSGPCDATPSLAQRRLGQTMVSMRMKHLTYVKVSENLRERGGAPKEGHPSVLRTQFIHVGGSKEHCCCQQRS